MHVNRAPAMHARVRSLEAGTAVISRRRVGDRAIPVPYLVGDGGQRHRQRWLLQRLLGRQGEEVVAGTAGLVVVEIRRRAVATNKCAELVDGGGGGVAANGGRVHQAEQRVRGRERVPGGVVVVYSHRCSLVLVMIAGCRSSRSARHRQVVAAGRLRRRLISGVIRHGGRRRALAVEEVQLGRSGGRRGRGRRRRLLGVLLLRRGGAAAGRARRGGAAVVDAGALVHAAEGDFSLQIHQHENDELLQ